MSEELVKYLSSFGAGVLIPGIIVVYLVIHPDDVQKWSALIYGWLASINRRFKYRATQSDIQSKLNSFVSNLADDVDMDVAKVRVKWTAREEDEDVQLEDNEVVIVMRDHGYKNKNFVHAAYFYISTTLLRHAKRHLSQKQGEAIDIYTTKNLIEKSNKPALEIFMRDYFQPLMEDERINKLVGQFVVLDKAGFYTHILLQELTYLGSKTFLSKKDAQVREEVANLIKYLETFAEREVGDDSMSEEFVGKYLHCAIKIVSTRPVRIANRVSVPVRRITRAFESGIENVYVIGPMGDGGEDFIKDACVSVMDEMEGLEIVREGEFSGMTKTRGEERPTSAYMVHIRNPASSRYLIEDSMVEVIQNFSAEDEGSLSTTAVEEEDPA
jgi:hypothetical protein